MRNVLFGTRNGNGALRRLGAAVGMAAMALAAALPHVPVFAQDELFLFGDEPLIEVAAKRATRLEEAPGTVIVLTREDIARMGAFTLGEALAYLVSSEMSPETFTPGLAFRGIPSPFNNKILLMVDGRILNSVYRGNFFLDFPQPIDAVKRIEIIRGPGSSLYGANAFAGVINVVLLKPEDIAGAQGEMVGGTEETAGFHLAAGETFSSGRHFTFRGRHFDTAGRDIINQVGNAAHNDYYAAMSWGKNRTQFSMGVQEFTSGWPGTPSVPFPDNRKNEKRVYLDGQTSWKIREKGRLSFRAYGDYRDNTYDITFKEVSIPFTCNDPENGAPQPCFGIVDAQYLADNGIVDAFDENGNPLPSASDTIGHFYTSDAFILAFELQSSTNRQTSEEMFVVSEAIFEWDFSDKSRFLAGVNHKWDSIDNSDIGKRNRGNYALFLQQEWRPSQKWILLAGGRYDINTIYGSFASPRVNAVFLPSPRWTFKTGYGRAFRAPSFLELYENTSFVTAEFRGNPQLEPEKINTYELQGQFRWGKERTGRLTTTLFRYDLDDEIGFKIENANMYVLVPDILGSQLWDCRSNYYWTCPDFTPNDPDIAFPRSGEYLNISKRVGQGGEFEMLLPLGKYLTVGGNFSHTRVEAPTEVGAETLEEHDFQRANASVILGGKRAHIGSWVRVMGERDRTILGRAHAYVDASAGLHSKHFHFTVRVSNVFDKTPLLHDAYGIHWHPKRDFRALMAFRKNL